MSNLTQEKLKTLLHYDSATGNFSRLNSTIRFNGKNTGRINNDGYVQIFVGGNYYQAHRLAWLYVVGAWPEAQIDHIDRCRTNNAFANLREATCSENMQNQVKALTSNKSTGILGVTWHKGQGKYQASITVRGKYKYLGLFDTKENAAEAYQSAKLFAHSFSPPLQELQAANGFIGAIP